MSSLSSLIGPAGSLRSLAFLVALRGTNPALSVGSVRFCSGLYAVDPAVEADHQQVDLRAISSAAKLPSKAVSSLSVFYSTERLVSRKEKEFDLERPPVVQNPPAQGPSQ